MFSVSSDFFYNKKTKIFNRMITKRCDKKKRADSFQKFMTTIEQLETLRNCELYDDCKTLVIAFLLFLE